MKAAVRSRTSVRAALQGHVWRMMRCLPAHLPWNSFLLGGESEAPPESLWPWQYLDQGRLFQRCKRTAVQTSPTAPIIKPRTPMRYSNANILASEAHCRTRQPTEVRCNEQKRFRRAAPERVSLPYYCFTCYDKYGNIAQPVRALSPEGEQ